MTGRPLQPELRPWPRWQRRLLTLSALIASIALLGLLGRPVGDPVQLVITGDRARQSYAQVVDTLVRQAERRVWVMVFVCHPEDDESGPVRSLLARLGAAAARGIDVRVVLDYGREWDTGEISDKHEAAAAILHQHGVQVVLDEIERTTHPKVVLVDDRHAVIGSHNWTRSAFVRNREVSTWHQDARLVAELEPVFLGVPGFAAGP